ncbi:MAG: hypothetical protein IH991_12090 [Planctomycetes bacterium]|nr:hypothetical protein [Planctomycetota bacterium]
MAPVCHFPKLSLAILVAVLVFASPATSDGAEISGARKDQNGFLVHTVQSEYQAGKTEIKVLLPDQADKQRRHEVLYVLPVEAGNGKRWGDGLLEIKRLGLHNKYGLICVFPTFSHLPWYADHPTNDAIRQESYLLKVVVPFVDSSYPAIAKAEGRLLVGFSKSGWGAFSLLLRHPTVFGKAAAWDAPLTMTEPNNFGMGPIFGTQENFQHYQITKLLEREAKTFGVGTPRLFHFGYGGFRKHHQETETLMNELRISHSYRDGPKRKHAWNGGWLPEAVEFLAGNEQKKR